MLLNQHNQKNQNKEDVSSVVQKRATSNANIPGKKLGGKDEKEPIKRRWFVGKEISPDGTVLNSPGLFKIVRDIEKLKHRPNLFPEKDFRRFSISDNKHKKLSITEHTQRIVQNLVERFGEQVMPTEEELLRVKKERERRENINKRFAGMAVKEKGHKEDIKSWLKDLAMKEKEFKEKVNKCLADSTINDRERKEKINKWFVEIVKKKNAKSKINFDEIVNTTPAEGAKKNIPGLSKVSQQLANIKRKESGFVPEIEHPFILPEDIEYEFENVYEDFLEDIKTKQDALESIKLKYKKQAQKLEEENAYNERMKKSKKQIRKDSKGNDQLPRTDYFIYWKF